MAVFRLYLIRHGKAHDSHQNGDRFRELSPRGISRIQGLLPHIRKKGIKVELFLSSPYQRARQTAALFEPLMEPAETRYSACFQPEGDPLDALSEIRACQIEGYKSIAVFTHNPFVTALTEVLLAARVTDLVFHTPTVAALEFSSACERGKAQLTWIQHPEDL